MPQVLHLPWPTHMMKQPKLPTLTPSYIHISLFSPSTEKSKMSFTEHQLMICYVSLFFYHTVTTVYSNEKRELPYESRVCYQLGQASSSVVRPGKNSDHYVSLAPDYRTLVRCIRQTCELISVSNESRQTVLGQTCVGSRDGGGVAFLHLHLHLPPSAGVHLLPGSSSSPRRLL